MTIIDTPRGFEIVFEYRPNITAEVKSIPGARFFGADKGWLIPKDQWQYVEGLRKKYIKVSPETLLPERILKIDELPDLEIDIPLRLEPYGYQKKGIARGLELKRFINGDEPGLGKTLQSIATVVALNAFPCLVICPATLKENWRREFEEKFSYRKAIVLTDKTKDTWPQYYRMGLADVFITNYESLKKFFVAGVNPPKKGTKPTLKDYRFSSAIQLFKSVIIDEIHKCKDERTIQAKLTKGICTSKEVVIGLTGTPVVNKPRDLMSQLSIIGRLKDFGTWSYFLNRYCQGGSGASNMRELNSRLNNICFFRREKKEVLTDLPDKYREVVLCDISTRSEYDKAKHEFVKYLTDKGFTQGEIDKKMKGEIMVKIQMLKDISARGKMAEVIEHVNEVVEAGEKMVIFCHLKVVAKTLLDVFPDAVTINGSNTSEEKQMAIDRFQNNPDQKLIICSIKAAGVGVTLTASSRLSFIELPWHPADVEQCESRIHRIGQKNASQITYFLGKDTIDEDIYKLIEAKRDVSNAITGATDDVEVMIKDLTRNLFNH